MSAFVAVVPLINRMVKKDVVINGIKLKKGQYVLASPWISHFRQAGFRNPATFDPTRFMNGQQHGYNYIPFGGGSNHCLGSGWSIKIVATIIELMTREFHLKGDCGSSAKDYDYIVFNLVRRRCDVQLENVANSNKESSPERRFFVAA